MLISWEKDIMKKFIYIIKNSCNNKVYIGQAKNPKRRWCFHKCNAKNPHTKSLVDVAISELGEENFYYEIIEETEFPDERERYWICQYNSLSPNGYNILKGGIIPGIGVEHPGAIIKTEKELFFVIDEIKNSGKTLFQISKETGISYSTISNINTGKSYRIQGLEYPIKQTRLERNIISNIKKDLKNSHDLTNIDISKKYGVDEKTVVDINLGKIYRDEKEIYPLRDGRVTYKAFLFYKDIINELANTDISMRQIAKKYGVSPSCISQINLGNNYKMDGIKHPIRINPEQSKLNVDEELRQKIEIEILKNEKTYKQIAKDLNISYYTVLTIKNRMS